MKKAQINIIVQMGIFAILAAFFTQLGEMPEEAKGYPTFLLIACAVVNATILFSDIHKVKKEKVAERDPDAPAVIKRIIIYILVLGIYIFLIEKIGYILSTILFCIANLQIMGVKSWRMRIVLPLCLTFSAFFVFSRLLMISLPGGTWINFTF